MTAADVIKRWSNELAGEGTTMDAIATAIQPGNPSVRSGNIAAYCIMGLRRIPDGSLSDPEVILFLSDREEREPDDSIPQPFDAHQTDSSEFILKLDGDLVTLSHTWGGGDTILLNDLGEDILGGWGESIGNKQVRAFWTIAVDGQVRNA